MGNTFGFVVIVVGLSGGLIYFVKEVVIRPLYMLLSSKSESEDSKKGK